MVAVVAGVDRSYRPQTCLFWIIIVFSVVSRTSVCDTRQVTTYLHTRSYRTDKRMRAGPVYRERMVRVSVPCPGSRRCIHFSFFETFDREQAGPLPGRRRPALTTSPPPLSLPIPSCRPGVVALVDGANEEWTGTRKRRRGDWLYAGWHA